MSPKYQFLIPFFMAVIASYLCMILLEPAQAVTGIIFSIVLIGASMCDLGYSIIPNRLSLGGILIAFILAFAIPMIQRLGISSGISSLMNSIIGMLIGSALLLWIALTAEIILKKEAIGFGDVKFMGCIGAFCGWKGALFSIFGGALIGALALLPVMIYRKEFDKEIPFGPWLALAAFLYFSLLSYPVDAYIALMEWR